MQSEDQQEIIRAFIENALREDIGDGDHTSLATIPAEAEGRARLLVKEACTIAGVELARMIFAAMDPEAEIEFFHADGDEVLPGDEIFHVRANVHTILKAERLVLNCMQRMSAIATQTRRITRLLAGTKTRVLDTRKTTPGMRYLEKWAVRIGGGTNHRFALYDMILIKDNHVDYAGGIAHAIRAAQKYLVKTGRRLDIEIEVRNDAELDEALETGGVQRIMLDNFDVPRLRAAVEKIGGRFVTEASGGITEATIRDYALTGVDYISVGALTHSVKSIDLSLKAI